MSVCYLSNVRIYFDIILVHVLAYSFIHSVFKSFKISGSASVHVKLQNVVQHGKRHEALDFN